jgi:hypothetical protein
LPIFYLDWTNFVLASLYNMRIISCTTSSSMSL